MAKIKINLDRAKEVHKKFVRKVRDPLLADLDNKFIRALEDGKSTTTIVSKKKKLRNATNISTKVNTFEKLLASWDETLLKKRNLHTASRIIVDLLKTEPVVEDSTPEEGT